MKFFATLLVVLATLPTAFSADPAPKPYLWRIGGGEKPSYVFGTIHLSGPKETTLAPVVEAAVTNADALFCEVPLDPANQMKAASAMLTGKQKLSETLPKELYQRSEAELKRINPALTLQPFEQMPVWALSVMLPILEEQLKNPFGQPLDAQLYNRALAAGKEVGGIETLDEQMGVFQGFTAAEQVAMLASTLDEMEKARSENRTVIEELRTIYLGGDLALLDAKLNESLNRLSPELSKRILRALITERNHRMAERMAAKLKAQPGRSFFFAVGAGHLHGDEGVVRLLQKAGLKLERVER